jgi:MFS family permease
MDTLENKTLLFWLQLLSQVAPIIGTVIGGFMMDSMGHKDAMMRSDVLILLECFLIMGIPISFIILVGRELIEISFGMTSVATQLYLVEISPSEIRGAMTMTNINNLMLTLIQILPYLMKLEFKNTVIMLFSLGFEFFFFFSFFEF